jgi:hypothetical protein
MCFVPIKHELGLIFFLIYVVLIFTPKYAIKILWGNSETTCEFVFKAYGATFFVIIIIKL